MSMRVLPFSKKTLTDSNLKLVSKGSKKSEDGDIIDHGGLGNLNYEIYKRGVIKIFDNKLIFKKDINIFENEVLKIDFDKMPEGDENIISGSGDNDNLIFSRINGDIVISLKKKEFAAVEVLKKVLSKGKEKLLGQ